MDTLKIDAVVTRMLDWLPSGNAQLRQDVSQNLRSLLSAALARMEIVTREEFDVQTALLERTRQRLEALQQQVSDLEFRLQPSPPRK